MLPLAEIFAFMFNCLTRIFWSFRSIFGGTYLVLFVLSLAVSLFVLLYTSSKNKDNNR